MPIRRRCEVCGGEIQPNDGPGRPAAYDRPECRALAQALARVRAAAEAAARAVRPNKREALLRHVRQSYADGASDLRTTVADLEGRRLLK